MYIPHIFKNVNLAASILIVLSMAINIEIHGQGIQHASIKISENGHYFLDRNNRPFFWQGDTEWELFRCLSASEAKSLMIERKKQGFNVIQVMATGVFPEWGLSKGMKAWQGLEAWIDSNPLKPDENYFKRVDSIVAFADQLDIILVVGVYHARDNDAGRITDQNIKKWSAWFADRYRNSRNIVFSMYPHASASSFSVVQKAVQGLKTSDSGTHLITMHPDPSPASSSFMHNSAWLSFNTLQTWNSDFRNYNMVSSDYARLPEKPVVNGEARYEDEDGTTPFEVRRAAYWSVMAGGFYSYGHRDNWNSPQTWRKWYATPGAKQMKIMGDFFRSIEWWKMVPDTSIFEKQENGNASSRSSGGDWILVYITNKESFILKLRNITASDSAAGWWINPLTGNRTAAGSYNTAQNIKFKIPEGWQDGLLFLKK